jgi:hypothetical protein
VDTGSAPVKTPTTIVVMWIFINFYMKRCGQ